MTLREQGLAALRAGDAAAAVQHLQAAVQQTPNDGQAWGCLGVALCQAKRAGEGVQALEKATGLLPREPTLQFNLGQALELAGRRDGALDAYRRCLNLDGNHAGATAAVKKLSTPVAAPPRPAPAPAVAAPPAAAPVNGSAPVYGATPTPAAPSAYAAPPVYGAPPTTGAPRPNGAATYAAPAPAYPAAAAPAATSWPTHAPAGGGATTPPPTVGTWSSPTPAAPPRAPWEAPAGAPPAGPPPPVVGQAPRYIMDGHYAEPKGSNFPWAALLIIPAVIGLIIIGAIVFPFLRKAGLGGSNLSKATPGLTITGDGFNASLPAGFPSPRVQNQTHPIPGMAPSRSTDWISQNRSGRCNIGLAIFPEEFFNLVPIPTLVSEIRSGVAREAGSAGQPRPIKHQGYDGEELNYSAKRLGRSIYGRMRLVIVPPRVYVMTFESQTEKDLQSPGASAYFDSLKITFQTNFKPKSPTSARPGFQMPNFSPFGGNDPFTNAPGPAPVTPPPFPGGRFGPGGPSSGMPNDPGMPPMNPTMPGGPGYTPSPGGPGFGPGSPNYGPGGPGGMPGGMPGGPGGPGFRPGPGAGTPDIPAPGGPGIIPQGQPRPVGPGGAPPLPGGIPAPGALGGP